MPTKSDTFKKAKETIEGYNDRFNKHAGTRQNQMWRQILLTIKKLDLNDQGDILPNSANLKILRNLRGDLKKTLVTPKYKKDVARYLGAFDELKGISDQYYKAIASGVMNANKYVFNAVKGFSIDATKESLLESGIDKEVLKPVDAILRQNVTTGAQFSDMQEALRADIIGSPDKLGRLERYTRQITTDSLNQFNANYNKTVSEDLGLEFYYYSGALKDTSRDYCKHMVNEGRYFHKQEVEDSANRDWAGKIPGTNSSSIFVNRGGYQCGHQWMAVDQSGVPKSVVDRAKNKGYINGTA